MQHFDETRRRGSMRCFGGAAGRLLAAGTLILGGGCSDGEDVTDIASTEISPGETPTSEPGGEGPGVAPETDEAPALYVISTRIRTPSSETSYLVAVNSLAEQPNVDLSRSLEVTGGAYGPPGTGKAYVASAEAGSMTEVTFDTDGGATPGRVVSFAGLGIDNTAGGNVNAFLSPTKAYHVNQGTLDVVVWNPEAMTLTSSFPTGVSLSEGSGFLVFLQQPIIVGDRLLLVSFQSNDGITGGLTTLTVVDTVNDRVLTSETDSRCSQFTSFARDPQGNLYFASNWLHAANYFLFGDLVPHPPCMLRIRAGETSFDPAWSRSLEAELGTSIWAGVFPGTGDQVLVQGLAEGLVSAAVETNELRSARPWRWYETHPQGAVQSLSADAALEGPLAVAGPVDGEYYLSSYLPDLGTSTLVETTAEGGIRPGIEVPGQVATLVRVY